MKSWRIEAKNIARFMNVKYCGSSERWTLESLLFSKARSRSARYDEIIICIEGASDYRGICSLYDNDTMSASCGCRKYITGYRWSRYEDELLWRLKTITVRVALNFSLLVMSFAAGWAGIKSMTNLTQYKHAKPWLSASNGNMLIGKDTRRYRLVW